MFSRKAVLFFLIVTFLFGNADPVQAAPHNKKKPTVGPVEVSSAVHSDVSAPIKDLNGLSPTSPTEKEKKKEKPLRVLPNMGAALKQPDGALQSSAGPLVNTTNGLNFAGVGQGDYGYFVSSAPPDTVGSVGDTQYVQWVNTSFAVFNKTTGAIVAGFPKAGNSIWVGFGGGCETNNDGDPIVLYDKLNNRWILSQFSVSTLPYLQCVAVSTTSDATGTYNRYAFSYGNTQFNDYPKLGVWSDGYYVSYNIFNNGQTFGGSKVCALDGAAMRSGGPATQQCFQLNSNFGGLLPSDLDGTTLPPTGAPNYFMNFGNNSLNLWKFHVDWVTPANTTFTGPTVIAVPSFSAACSGGGTCIPQPGTSQRLDSLGDRLMFRLAYRNYGDHQSLVVNHSVTAGASVGVRWYEIRNPDGTPSVYQSGTFAPDSNYRWMGSIAMDKVGDIALGYSVSSSTVNPSIRYTGRVPTDPLGTLQAETTILSGGGSQSGNNLSRWGDYSSLSVDPVDDCTFWYTNEYLKSTGSFNWSTRIASFKFPNCGNQVLTSISVSPASASVQVNATQQFTATGLDQFGQPMNPQPSITWAVSGGGTISATGLFTAGTSTGGPFTVTATSGSVNGTASVTVMNPSPVLTSISVSPASTSVQTNATQQFTATGLDQFGQPMNPQPTFAWAVSGGGTINTAGLFTAGTTAGGPFTVTASSGSVNGTASVTVTNPPPVLTSISVSPASASVVVNTTQQFTATGLDQFSQPMNPQPTFTWVVSGGGTISTAGLFTAGTSAGGPFTVTASSGTINGTASVTVVNKPDFSIKISPTSQSVRRGFNATYTVTITALNSFSGQVALSIAGQPTGSIVKFTPNPTANSSTLTITTLASTNRQTYTLIITGVSGSLSHFTNATLTVTR